MADKYITLQSDGFQHLVAATESSTGVDEAGKIVALNDEGKLDESLLPDSVINGGSVVQAISTATLYEGLYVAIDASGVVVASSSGTPAEGFVKAPYAVDEIATVYPLTVMNDKLTGLVVGTRYYLDDDGTPTSVPFSSTGYPGVHQYLGRAISPTTIVHSESDPIWV